MSQWTHVNGSIRFNALRMQGMPFASIEDIKEYMGKTFSYDDNESTWDACDVPSGSEGSLQFTFWANPSTTALAAYTVGIFGDLRDFGSEEDIESLKKWFNEKITGEGVMVRSAILEIDVEYGEKTILTVPEKEDSSLT